MFCKHCGKEINESSKFCKYCGGDVRITASSSTAQQSRSTQPLRYTAPVTPKKRFNPLGWIMAFFFVLFIIGVASDSGTSSSSTSSSDSPNYDDFDLNIDLEEPSASDYSLPHGTVLKQSNYYLSGEGVLEISNGTRYDAVAKLISGNTAVYSVYIRANRDYIIEGISDGYYELMFAQGSDWDTVTKQFNKNQSYSAFDEMFDFITTEDEYYYYPPGFEVTLNPVVGGTAETSSVNPADFNSY